MENKKKFTHGGKRVAGPGKALGRPTDIGTNGRKYLDYLDDETIAALKAVHPVRSIAIRMLAKGLDQVDQRDAAEAGEERQHGQQADGNLGYNKNMKLLDSLNVKDVALFSKRWKILEFAVFGSILRDDFKPESDVDVLVTFSQTAEWGLFDHVQMRNELESMLGRKVDLVTRRALEQTQNHILRARIMSSAMVIFSEDEAAYV